MALATMAIRGALLCSQAHLFFWLRRLLRDRGLSAPGVSAGLVAFAGLALLLFGDMFQLDVALTGVARREPGPWRYIADIWTAALAVSYPLLLAGGLLLWWRRRVSPEPPPSPSRRRLLKTAAVTAAAAPLALAGYGTFIGRTRFELKEVEIAIPGLPKDLRGLKIAQLTDMHVGPFLSPRELERAVSMANETRPHLTVLTGDIITKKGDPLDAALETLSKLKSDAGVWGCMGNHEQFAKCVDYTAAWGARRGMEFLRHRNAPLRFGDALLNLAGVDYQRRGHGYLVDAEELILPGATNLLLSHNPDVFPEAEALGYDLMISGHTHGGQVTLEIVEQNVNAGHFFTPYVVGEYRRNNAALYVSRGIGCVNLPMRIGAWPEITLLKLKSA